MFNPSHIGTVKAFVMPCTKLCILMRKCVRQKKRESEWWTLMWKCVRPKKEKASERERQGAVRMRASEQMRQCAREREKRRRKKFKGKIGERNTAEERVYVWVYYDMHTHIHMYIYTCIHIHIYTCICTYIGITPKVCRPFLPFFVEFVKPRNIIRRSGGTPRHYTEQKWREREYVFRLNRTDLFCMITL